MKRTTCLLVVILIFVSCKPLMLKMYRIKTPAVENETSIKAAAICYGLDTSCILTVAPEYITAMLGTQGLPDIAVFDSSGAYIEYRDTSTSCNSGLFDFIPALHTGADHYRRTGKTTLQKELRKLRDINGHLLSSEVEKADFYLLVYWTVWIGKLNKDHVKIWEQLAHENKSCKIKVLKVNLDIQEFWPAATKDQLLQMTNKKK